MTATVRKQSVPVHAIQVGAPFRLLLLIAGLSLLTSLSAASAIAGKVMNRSRNQPAAGDDVVLYRVDRTMHEVSRTKSDAHGEFQFEGSGSAHYLVAVFHQKVSYHTSLLRGPDPVEVSVYDAVPKLAGVQEASNTLFPRAAGDLLRVTEFLVVLNQSNPPRTLSAQQPFIFRLPKGAVLESTAVQPPGTLPFLVSASGCGAREQYCIAYPIRPGTTKVRAVYHLPYSGNVSITQPLLHPVREVAWVVPESLLFETKTPGILTDRGTQNGLSTYQASSVRAGQSLTFTLSGMDRAREKEAAATTIASSGPARPVQQTALLSPGKHFPSWTILIGALVSAVSLATLACGRVMRPSA